LLKVKDNIDLEKLIDLGFERRYNVKTGELDSYEYNGYQDDKWGRIFSVYINVKTRALDFYVPYSNSAYSDFMFKLYQTDYFESVPNKKENKLFFWRKN